MPRLEERNERVCGGEEVDNREGRRRRVGGGDLIFVNNNFRVDNLGGKVR